MPESSNKISSTRLKITQDIKVAMKAADKFTLSTLRMIFAAINQVEIDTRANLDDNEVFTILKKCIKQRQESARHFINAKRNELAEKEQNEIKIIETYLPKEMSDAELDALIELTIKESGAQSMKQMGQVISILKQKTANRADMAKVSAKVKSILNQ